MPELTIVEMFRYSLYCLLESKFLVLLVLELILLFGALIFSRFMDKKVVKITTILTAILILGFYAINYIDTFMVFINNVTTQIIDMIYFPTTFEFILILAISFGIMIITYLKKSSRVLKITNSIVPIFLSFIFLNIIEYINSNAIPFDEFSVFSDPVLMSLYELGMSMFVTWLAGILIYKIDIYLINRIKIKEETAKIDLTRIEEINLDSYDDYIEMPRLKSSIKQKSIYDIS